MVPGVASVRVNGINLGLKNLGSTRLELEELGFPLDVVKMSDWTVGRLRELKEFKKRHGHCNVPFKYPGGLGNWVMRQRYLGKEKCQRLDADLVEKLEKLNFRWDTVKKFSWEERFQQLKEFREEHGHCNVPKTHAGGLGHWVNDQRRGKERLQCRSAEQAQKLEDLGF